MSRIRLIALGLSIALLFTACSEEESLSSRPGGASKPTEQTPPPPPPSAPMPSQAAPPSDANDFATTIMQCYRQITDALASVSDEQSARAAAPILTQATDRLKPAFERLVAAARSGAFSARNTNVEENAKAFYNMKSEIERVYPSPAGQFLKPELRRLLDTLVESAIAGDRTRTEKWIQDHNLNQ